MSIGQYLRAVKCPPILLPFFTFSGPTFQQGIIPQNCNLPRLTYLARHLYILDPVYGVLRSMERIQPYRLETGCKGVIEEGGPSTKKESLCSFWNESITAYMRNRMTPTSSVDCGSILVNVASDEYSSSIDILSLPRNTIFLNVLDTRDVWLQCTPSVHVV
eukprot:CCRYP_019800-RA/>CCRYP_019800-RA protein AED:0.14 eAED:0.18 QI:323/1/0.5/1/0/0/2/0/160